MRYTQVVQCRCSIPLPVWLDPSWPCWVVIFPPWPFNFLSVHTSGTLRNTIIGHFIWKHYRSGYCTEDRKRQASRPIGTTKQLGSGIFIGQLLIIFNYVWYWDFFLREIILVSLKQKFFKILSGMRIALHLYLTNLLQKYGDIILLVIFSRWDKWCHLFSFIWWDDM